MDELTTSVNGVKVQINIIKRHPPALDHSAIDNMRLTLGSSERISYKWHGNETLLILIGNGDSVRDDVESVIAAQK